MIYVVVGNYEIYNPGSGYSDLIEVNQYVTDFRVNLKDIKQLTYTYEDMSNDKKYTVVPYTIDVQVWQNGEKIGVHDFNTLDELKGWASNE
jgi:hypothetical protein